MTEYHIKLDDNEATADAVLKVLGMVYHKGYDVSLDAAEHVITITTKEEDTRQNTIKKTLKKVRRKLFWRSIWKSICRWVARKGYWISVLIGVPIIVLGCRTDTASSIMIAIWIDTMIILFSTV